MRPWTSTPSTLELKNNNIRPTEKQNAHNQQSNDGGQNTHIGWAIRKHVEPLYPLYLVYSYTCPVLGTETYLGLSRLSASRPKKVFGFRLFEGNNRNRKPRTFRSVIRSDIPHNKLFFSATFAPPWVKNVPGMHIYHTLDNPYFNTWYLVPGRPLCLQMIY